MNEGVKVSATPLKFSAALLAPRFTPLKLSAAPFVDIASLSENCLFYSCLALPVRVCLVNSETPAY